jgi:VWFA-related protein
LVAFVGSFWIVVYFQKGCGMMPPFTQADQLALTTSKLDAHVQSILMTQSIPGTLCRASRLWRLLVVVGVLLLGSAAFASHSQDEKQKPFTLQVPAEYVIVPVTVEDEDGSLIPGLQREDFELLEEGVPQNITYFSADPVPLSVAILIDRTTDAETQTTLKETVLPLVEAFSPFDEIALFEFEHVPRKLQDFTANKEEVLLAFNKISLTGLPPGFSGGPFGGSGGQFSGQTTVGGVPLETGTGKVQPPKTLNTHIHDAVFTAAQELRLRDRNRRAVIVLISNGQNAPGNRNSFDATMEALVRREITIFAIAQGSSLIARKLNLLRKYAYPTGGEVFYPVRNSGFADSYRKIAQMARNRYVLGYIPKGRVEEMTFRRITVRLRHKDFKAKKVVSRNGYYAVPR